MKNLRPYQKRGKEEIYKEWDIYDILFFVLATGGGKSVIATDVIKDYVKRGKRVLFIAHREQLITQFWQHLYEAKIYSGILMNVYPPRYDLPVQVCSIQTIANRKYLPPTDLIVIDEAHHVTDKNSYSKILKQFPEAKVLLISATPYRLSGEGFKNLVPGKETGLIINSTISSLQADGWLVPFRYLIASFIDTSTLHISRGDYIEDEVYNQVKLIPLVDSYLQWVPGKQGIIYASNVAHSLEIVQQYESKGIPCAHIDANTPEEERNRIYTEYRAGLIKCVSNVGILTEGSDFPNCDFVQWGCLTKSLSKFLQGCGRTTRTLPGLVDQYGTSIDRRDAIAASSKPHGIILDNTGMFKEHGFPDDEHNWVKYFNGTKGVAKEKQTDKDLEILVYLIEDKNGQRKRTSNISEIEGMELIEVTREIKQKVVNIKSLKEFDYLYAMFKKSPRVNKPGYLASRQYIKYCQKHDFLMVPEIWEYLKQKLVYNIVTREEELADQLNRNPGQFQGNMYQTALESIRAQGVSINYLKREEDIYNEANKSQLDKFNAMK